MLKKIKGWAGTLNLKNLSVAVLLLAASFIIYFWRLASLTPGFSPAEAAARSSTQSIHNLLSNPINAPQRLLQYLAQKAGYHGFFSMRLASVVIAILFVACTFWLMKTWFGLTIGVFSSLIFATTPLMVLLARTATPDVMLLMPVMVIAAYVWLTRRRHQPNAAWLGLVAISALSFYVPGMAWLMLIGALLLRKRLLNLIRLISRKIQILSLLILILLIMPLVWALVGDISIYRGLLLIPAHWMGIGDTMKSIGWSALALVWRVRTHNPLIIGRLPLLDIIQIALIVFGTYAMWTKARREMASLLTLIVVAIIFAGFNSNFLLLTLCLPALTTLIGAGLRYLYIEWRSVFPRNPLPLSFALILMACLVGLQVLYGLKYSLVAWPHTPSTKQLYVLK
jgi:4-amino-4-deoxy-L-arabinose transferase-like glycosyltransferase